ncbi:hypothetical protein [Ectopseudomonas oleovorans]|uniref:hypothetical protein n=1 Tax=Ectopseudomonas oleovorans TaxID=301 RepID=UPI003F1CE9BA
MAESVIVDAQGRPIHKTELLQELVQASTTGVYQAWTVESVSATPRPAWLRSILNAAAQGEYISYLTRPRKCEKDPHYAAVLGTRAGCPGLPVVVGAASEDERDEQLPRPCASWSRRPEFSDMLDDPLDASCALRWPSPSGNRSVVSSGRCATNTATRAGSSSTRSPASARVSRSEGGDGAGDSGWQADHPQAALEVRSAEDPWRLRGWWLCRSCAFGLK